MGIQSATLSALEACSPAKLNLFLHVTDRRADGYHNLQTVFQLLNWGDEMRFERREAPGVTLSGDTDDIAPADNLILRAANALGAPDLGAHIHIRKQILAAAAWAAAVPMRRRHYSRSIGSGSSILIETR
jgi:4-diphosphocytidyl-2-C-methyl-D-erythritol kinase